MFPRFAAGARWFLNPFFEDDGEHKRSAATFWLVVESYAGKIDVGKTGLETRIDDRYSAHIPDSLKGRDLHSRNVKSKRRLHHGPPLRFKRPIIQTLRRQPA